MEASSIYALSSIGSAIAGSPTSSVIVGWLSNWWAKRKLRKRLSAMLMMKGVSTLCGKLTTADVLFLDVDKLFQTLNLPSEAGEAVSRNPVDIVLSYPTIRAHVVNISSVFKGRIVLVSKSLELLHALPVKEENITFACFSKAMEENIKIIYSSEVEHHDAEVQKYRVLREIPEAQMFVAESLADLYKKAEELYGVKRQQL
jgi:hypothetical protein